MSEHTPTFFPGPADFRAWLEEHHATTDHLWMGYYKKATNKPSVTWEDSVDEALCFGWIDGIRKSRDDESYMIRFTPRKPTSVWSQRNIDRVEQLTAEGRMKPEGLAAFAFKDVHPESGYATAEFDGALTLGIGLRAEAGVGWRRDPDAQLTDIGSLLQHHVDPVGQSVPSICAHPEGLLDRAVEQAKYRI